jgi:UDP:flavonoid glycosyltransferase YjiC (YdhE family)
MRIRLITIGSHGDVRPYVALGAGLQNAGHDVRIISNAVYGRLAREHGLDFAPVTSDPREQADSPELRALHNDGRNLFRWYRAFKEVDAPLMRQRLRDCWEACADADVIVISIIPYLYGYAVARKLDVPLVRGFYFPVSPTRFYPPDFVPTSLGRFESLNLASYHAQRQVLWQIARPWFSKACREVLGLRSLPRLEPFGELDRQRQLLLYGYSRAVAPPPSDWGDWIKVTGYWFLDRPNNWAPPPALTAFLDSGDTPVCISFGSMSSRRLLEIAGVVSRALALTGKRAVMLTEWGGLSPPDLPPEVFVTERIPHDWLFPRVSAAVHHGGAGTTSRSLLAGIPSIVVPHFFDQFFWARRVYDLGAGPRPILSKRLTADALASALKLVTTDQTMQGNAAALGQIIRGEDGVARAVAAFERYFNLNSKPKQAYVGRDQENP